MHGKAELEADLEAGNIVGRETLLDVLRKISTLRLEDVERRKKHKWLSRAAGRPTIDERITNLELSDR